MVFPPSGSYIKNLQTGRRIQLEDQNGTRDMGMEFVAIVYDARRQAGDVAFTRKTGREPC